MVFKTLDEYIFKIIESSERAEHIDEDLKIIIPEISIRGNLYDENNKMNDFYIIGKNNNHSGLNIGNGKYIFTQNKVRFIDTEEAKIIFQDEEASIEQLEKEFENVELFSFYESDKQNNEIRHYSFIVNGSSFLLLDYFNIYQNENKTKSISLSLKEDYLNPEFLRKREFTKSKQPRKKFNKIYVPNQYHKYYNISYDRKETENDFIRINLINKIYGESLNASNEYYGIEENIKCCFNTISEEISRKFKTKDIEERS